MFKRLKAFSLIELIIVLTITGILAIIGMSAYQSYVLRSYRTEALTFMLNLANSQEQYYGNHGAYSDNFANLDSTADALMPRYQLAIVLSEDAQNYEIIADAYGAQLEDVKCLHLSLNHVNQRNNNVQSSQHCWQ